MYFSWIYSGILLLLGFLCESSGRATIKDNGFEDFVIAISPDIPQDDNMIDSIQSMLNDMSRYLYIATRKRAYLRTVKILLPKTWKYATNGTLSGETFQDAEFRIDRANSAYGDSPYTKQTTDCGIPGYYTHLTPEYVKDGLLYGDKGKTLIHEFAKLRWGVFEEHGYPGDEKFPMFYQKDTWTIDGQTTVTKPNFCLNGEIKGYEQDIETGAACALSSDDSGLPNENCMFYATQDSSLTSSLMALPYLSTNVNFCDEDENSYLHSPDIPTKQNLYCKGRSTWSVIEDSEDFRDNLNPPIEITNPEPQFIIVGGEEQDMSYVMVMDISGSMSTSDIDRMSPMKDAAKRWVMYDVREGTSLGILPFSSSPKLEHGFNMTAVDEVSRNEMIEKIDGLKANGGTCITDAIVMAVKYPGLLNDTQGNSIILLTDGEQSFGCSTDYEQAKQLLILHKIRLVTIALGDYADPEIEGLAIATGGKTYFVDDDSGPGDFSDALAGSTTYQPADTINNTDIVIFQQSWGVNQTIDGTFDVDASIGKNLTFRLEIKNGNENCSENINIQINEPKKEPLDMTFLCSQENLGTIIFQINGEVSIGTWQFEITTKESFDALSVVITSRSSSSGDDPIQTECWFNQGEEEINNSTVMKVSVVAEVTKGNMPVMGAKVHAYITRPLENETMSMPAVEMELLDNGSGADVVKNDGIYSKYFTEYTGEGRYTVKCQVVGNEGTLINEGFIASRALPEKPGAPVCCGSNALHPNSKTSKSGAFTRQSVGGSFQAKAGEVPDGDVYPPSRVTDLKITNMCGAPQLKFTSPGDDFDSSKPVVKYTIKYSKYANNITEDTFDDPSIAGLSDNDVVNDLKLTPRNGSVLVVLELNPGIFEDYTTYSFGMHATDEAGNKSPLSNIAKGRCAPQNSGVSQLSTSLLGLSTLLGIMLISQ